MKIIFEQPMGFRLTIEWAITFIAQDSIERA